MPNDLSPVSQSPDSTLASAQAEILDRGFLASKRWTKTARFLRRARTTRALTPGATSP